MRILLGVLAVLALSTAAHAEVIDAQPNGFEVKRTVQIAAAPDKVYAALIQPGRWWNSSHSWSGDAANLTLEPKVGGCWCEAGRALTIEIARTPTHAANRVLNRSPQSAAKFTAERTFVATFPR